MQKSLEWPGGCEDPRIAVTVDGLYVMMYTQWNRDIPRLAVATSKDLVHWTKYGPAFAKAYDGKFYNMACKSGSILTELIDGRQVIKKVGGKYFMYWGEEHVFAATSEDLVNWTPIVNIDGSLKRLFSPRDGYFDSQLTECGPPAIYTPKGIVLLYNGKTIQEREINVIRQMFMRQDRLFLTLMIQLILSAVWMNLFPTNGFFREKWTIC